MKQQKTWEEALKHCRAMEAVDISKPATNYQNYRYDLATLLIPDDHVYAREKAQEATTDEVGQFSAVSICVIEQLVLCVYISLVNVGRCGRACVTWLVSGFGWVENKCSTRVFKAAQDSPPVASWRKLEPHSLG